MHSRRAQLFAEMADDVLVGIEMFDIELFAAYVDDWRVRVCDIGQNTSAVCPVTAVSINWWVGWSFQRYGQQVPSLRSDTRNC
jgi:hypothetical protein